MADESRAGAWLENKSLADLCLLVDRRNVRADSRDTRTDVIKALLGAEKALGFAASKKVGHVAPAHDLAIITDTAPTEQLGNTATEQVENHEILGKETNTPCKRKREEAESYPVNHADTGAPEGGEVLVKRNVLLHLAQFVPNTQFLFFAPVSRGWKAAWGQRPTTTNWATPDTSVSQLRYSFKCGLPRDRSWVCAAIARLGKLDLLGVAIGKGCPMKADTCSSAALGGHLKVLRFARRVGCRWNTSTTASAARGGNIKVLQWCLREGCPSDASLCAAAAEGGHLDILRGARRRKFPWSSSTCSGAARGGHLHTLKWALRHGCVGGREICLEASKGGRLDILRWARENGCSWHKMLCLRYAEEAGHEDVAAWIREESP